MNKRIALMCLGLRISPHFFYSSDETFLWFSPLGGCRTLEVEGSEEVKATGAEDKRGCTYSVTVKADGTVLPGQLIYGGKTSLSTPGHKPNKATAAWQPLPAREKANREGYVVTQSPVSDVLIWVFSLQGF
jgi:hypothetical protein